MPGIKIHRKSRLKTVNSSKSKELDIQQIEEEIVDSKELSTPGGKPNPKPYRPINNDNDYLDLNWYEECIRCYFLVVVGGK